jgi:hypothetical protein
LTTNESHLSLFASILFVHLTELSTSCTYLRGGRAQKFEKQRFGGAEQRRYSIVTHAQTPVTRSPALIEHQPKDPSPVQCTSTRVVLQKKQKRHLSQSAMREKEREGRTDDMWRGIYIRGGKKASTVWYAQIRGKHGFIQNKDLFFTINIHTMDIISDAAHFSSSFPPHSICHPLFRPSVVNHQCYLPKQVQFL